MASKNDMSAGNRNGGSLAEEELEDVASLKSVGIDVEDGSKRLPNKAKSMYYTGKSMVQNAGELLDVIPHDKEVTLTFNNINSWVPNMLFGQAKQDAGDSAPAKRQILYDVSGAALPGECLALMGPSGSGKTSLISILGGRAHKSISVTGDMLFNGKAPGKSIKRKMGFVLQDDKLFPDLTVWETLWFAAQLRLPKTMSTEEKTERVTNVIMALGLDKCKDTIIGGFMRRGVSGGERKRVSVGHELLINPSIIFLDEPTSGLDSTTALALVSTLETLAAGGRSVVTTIHQPSSRMFQKLEKLMLLSEGRVLYYGYNAHCVEWFRQLGTPCPFGVNVADFILDLANANQGLSKEDGQAIRAKQVNAFKSFADGNGYSMETGVVQESLELAAGLAADASSKVMHSGGGDSAAQLAKNGSKMFTNLSSALSISRKAGTDDADEKRSWGSSWATQFTVLFSRSIKTRRFESLGVQRVIQLLGVAIIAGMFYFQLGGKDTLKSARDVAGLLFFQLLFPSINSMFSALFVFPAVTQMVMKERQSGMYRLSAFYLSHTLSDLPMDCFLPTLFIFITYFMGGLRLTVQAWFCNWMAIMLTLLTTQSIGLVLGAGVTDVKTAQTVATIVLLTVMLAGGFFVAYVPAWIAWVRYVSFIYYGYRIVLHIEFQGRTLYDCPPGVEPPNTSCSEVTDVKTALGLTNDPNDSVLLPVGILFLMLICLRLAIYFVLNNKTKQRR